MPDVTSSRTFRQLLIDHIRFTDQISPDQSNQTIRTIKLIRPLLVSISNPLYTESAGSSLRKRQFPAFFLRYAKGGWRVLAEYPSKGQVICYPALSIQHTAGLSRNVNLLTQSTCQHAHTSAVTILHFLLLANLTFVASNIFLLLSSCRNYLNSFLHLTPL
jgi:hypothetical protein